MIVIGDGLVLCYDELTDRYFHSTMEKIRRAELAAKQQIIDHNMVSLGFFHDEIGLKVTSWTDTVGWNSENPIELRVRATMAGDDKPCLNVDFATSPTATYNNHSY